jgi:hypothetical protein
VKAPPIEVPVAETRLDVTGPLPARVLGTIRKAVLKVIDGSTGGPPVGGGDH